MQKGKCLLLVLLALAVGVLIGKLLPHSNTMAMMITAQGRVYPSPVDGDVLKWIDLLGNGTDVTWDGPPQSPIPNSPCTDNVSTQCTIKYKAKPLVMYHYKCKGCGDPSVPGPHSNGGFEGQSTAASPGGNVFSAEAAVTDKNVSGVWYFDPGAGTSGFVAIPVATYAGQDMKNDQIAFDRPIDANGQALPWMVVMDNTQGQTCQEQPGNTSGIGNLGQSTCTVLTSAKSQNYCVVFNGLPPGPAVLVVNGVMNPTNMPPPPCTK